ncbi:MAG: class I SAM-dependent methyltransferase [Methanobacterium sp.]|uniref:class I SAM-dependent methyltransferase n=1 Tax=Methanobacterium sp. TaxID=2164 RepID=UPI003D6500D2|nr:class I SAM-dependent methyltransferase [Methanobacterium sp.]
MANAYDKMCQLLVPGYDFMQDTMIDILKFEDINEINLLDLGAGSGILIEKVLKEFPDSTCYYLDFSDDFMHVAKEKLDKYEDRITYIKSDFCSNWESQLKEKPNVIISMSAIHHLKNENKRKLYGKCYKILQEKGWFFNIDEMKTLNETTYMNSLYYWIYHAEKQKYALSDNQLGIYNQWMEKFDSWKKRNVENIHIPKKDGDDVHESFLVQLNWLKEIGFSKTDLFSKYFLWCMIGGKKE